MGDSPAPQPRRPPWRWIILGVLLLVAAIAGSALGRSLRFDLPNVDTLENYSPPVITRVLGRNGTVVDTFSEQKRLMIEHREIPESFKNALVAVEDQNFYHHAGFDFQGIARIAISNVFSGTRHGASTLTQQLARNLFLHPKKTLKRKFQELLLAVEIERQYSKDEIMRFYCNQIYMGHGRYGIEAASRHYFGKPASEMSLAESALLAAVIQRPESISPFRNPERALNRRNYVLSRMVKEGFIDQAQAQVASREPVPDRTSSKRDRMAPYFVEQVRRWLQSEMGSESLYRAGLEVRTTLDPALQAIANEALDTGVRALDKRQGWRGPAGRVPEGEDAQLWEPESWRHAPRPGQVVDGVVVEVGANVRVRVGGRSGTLDDAAIAWTGRRKASRLLDVGDLVRVRVLEFAGEDGLTLSLEQAPQVEAALIAIEPGSGAIRALVGGFDFERSEFDRAIQARRQSGSAFKPFVFATALSRGWTLSDVLLDEPTVFLDPRQPVPYLPKNYTDGYYGPVTLRSALEKSANVATVKLLNAVGPREVIATARRLGIESDLQPFPSLALGSFECTLLELTGAYATFANQGVRVEPHFVEEVIDRSGNTRYRVEPAVHDALSPQIAYLMNRLLGGVISDGTGKAAAGLGFPLAGKTGTTDDNTDAWFIGYSRELAVGVWVGFDAKQSIGSRETGAQAALPIWQTFMERAHEGLVVEDFAVPDGISVAVIDRATGLKANPSTVCARPFSESYAEGSEPTEYCTAMRHRWYRLPYVLQRYELDESGRLVVPELELMELLRSEPSIQLSPTGMRIVVRTGDDELSFPLRISPGGDAQRIPEAVFSRLEEDNDPSTWVGTDGRKARIELFRY